MGRSGSMPVAGADAVGGHGLRVVGPPGRRAVPQDRGSRHAPAAHHQVSHRVAHGQEAGGVARPVAFAAPHDLPHQPGHARQPGGLGVVVGHVVDEATAQAPGSAAHHGQHDERLGVEDVGLGSRGHDGLRPGTGAAGVGDRSQASGAEDGAGDRVPVGHPPAGRVASGSRPTRRLMSAASPLRQRLQGAADAPIDVQAGEPHAGRQLLLRGQAGRRPAQDAQLMAVLCQRRRRAQEARVELEGVGGHDGDVQAALRGAAGCAGDQGGRTSETGHRHASDPGPRPRSSSQRSRRTTTSASRMIDLDILLLPTSRSLKTMGTSTMRAPPREAR